MLDRRVETFLKLCETMSYRAAAEQLHITQPAVTQHIHALEQHYGCELFRYDGRSLSRTRDAELLERTFRAMLYQEKRLRAELTRPQAAHFNIGVTKTIAEAVVAPQAARFLDAGNTLTLDVNNTEYLMQRLNRGELDFALIEGFFDAGRYDSLPYSRERFVGLCSAGHRFARRRVPVDEAAAEPLILREQGSGTREIMEGMLHSLNRSAGDFRRSISVSGCALLCALVERGCGVSFGYDVIARRYPGIGWFLLDGIDIAHDFCYVFLKGGGAQSAVKMFDSFRGGTGE